jgi:hypothetical protein
VRCARCRTIWFAAPRDAEPIPATAGTRAGHPAEAFAVAWPPAPRDTIAADVDPAGPTGDLDAELGQPIIVPGADPATVDARADDPAGMAQHPDGGDGLGPIAAPPPPPDAEAPRASAAAAAAPIEAGEDIESVAARRARREAARRHRLALIGFPTLAAALLALDATLVVRRADVVRLMPQTASLFAAVGLPVNVRGLAFTGVTTSRDTHDGTPVLVVEGSIVGSGVAPAAVPPLRFALRDEKGQEIYSWTAPPPRAALGAGETQTFRSRLAAPPAESRDVVVRFVHRRDAAGTM